MHHLVAHPDTGVRIHQGLDLGDVGTLRFALGRAHMPSSLVHPQHHRGPSDLVFRPWTPVGVVLQGAHELPHLVRRIARPHVPRCPGPTEQRPVPPAMHPDPRVSPSSLASSASTDAPPPSSDMMTLEAIQAATRTGFSQGVLSRYIEDPASALSSSDSSTDVDKDAIESANMINDLIFANSGFANTPENAGAMARALTRTRPGTITPRKRSREISVDLDNPLSYSSESPAESGDTTMEDRDSEERWA
ncbi:hypothetical protein HYFRA_00007472 [Hymenoscyphus fraxineus]|uniref:Uncharacterized protein n=1 Tax=Hymenoscyphus fraxineus TaxID=746836 RepID=A0A9N9KR24_9HELO|nr:hypothetical protein HYFRA_00007472 [Hymenoscyphus fraxineus]